MSKAKGMWMGGVPPLGYDLPQDKSRTLVLNEAEAEAVRLIFRQYLKLGSVHALESWLKQRGAVSKQYISGAGRTVGGAAFSRGALYHLLRNPIYLGLIRHKGECHAGQHAPIVERALFNRVQNTLDAKRKRHAERATERFSAPLAGRIFDALGEPMSPTVSRGKLGKRYRYYVSAPLQKGGSGKALPGQGRDLIQRISADALEVQLTALIVRLVPGHASNPLALPKRIEVQGGSPNPAEIRLPGHSSSADRRRACRGGDN